MSDWISEMFPGDGSELPTDEERDSADTIIVEWSARWGEVPRTIDRERSVVMSSWTNGQPGGVTHMIPTNRAYLRSQLRRWWAIKTKV